jgi:hypothetical protein
VSDVAANSESIKRGLQKMGKDGCVAKDMTQISWKREGRIYEGCLMLMSGRPCDGTKQVATDFSGSRCI